MTGTPTRMTTSFLALAVIFLTLSLVFYPEQGFEAGVSGMKVFWDIVFPSLLPFFILSELLLGVGVVHALGVLLEPLMRPLFSVPGYGAFALSMGLAAGYPMDAVITAKFRRNKMCSRVEGERLLAFTNTADPLFMFGAVAVGMFRNAGIGMLLAIAHYISAFIVGVLFKLYRRREVEVSDEDIVRQPSIQGNILVRAFNEMMRARKEDGRPFGKLLGDAVNDSVKTLLMIGGFIILFAVLIKVMTLAGIIPLLAMPFQWLFHAIGIDTSLVGPFLSGIFEIDIGSAQVAATKVPLIEQLIIVSFIIAWSGLSVHAQVASVLVGTDIRFSPYVIARVLHATFAGIITLILFNMGMGQQAAQVFWQPAIVAVSTADSLGGWTAWWVSLIALKNGLLLLGGITTISVLTYFVTRSRWIFWRVNKRKV